MSAVGRNKAHTKSHFLLEVATSRYVLKKIRDLFRIIQNLL